MKSLRKPEVYPPSIIKKINGLVERFERQAPTTLVVSRNQIKIRANGFDLSGRYWDATDSPTKAWIVSLLRHQNELGSVAIRRISRPSLIRLLRQEFPNLLVGR